MWNMNADASIIESKVNAGAVLAIMSCASFITPFMGSALNVALPSMSRDLHMGALLLSWTQTTYLLATAILLVPFGRLADIFGRRLFFIVGLSLFTVATAALALSPTAWFMLSMRVLQSVGGAMAYSTSMPILISVFPPQERGRAIGFASAATYVGLSFGPFIGGVLTESFGWRYVFAVIIPISVAAIIGGLRFLRTEWRPAQGERFDIVGACLYGIALVTLMFGFSRLPHVAGAGLLGCTIIVLGVFGFWEIRSHSPMLDLRLFGKNPAFGYSNLAALINYAATYAVGFLLSLYLQYVRGLSPREAGTLLVAQPIMMALLSPLAGRLSDRLEPRLLASIGMALTALVLLALYALDAATPLWELVAILVVLGTSFAMFSSPNTNAVMSSVEKKFYGVASGTLGTMRMTGQMLSMAIATLVLAVTLGDVALGPENSRGILSCVNTTFLICGVLCVFGVLASMARGRVHE